jgi:hypothetical protein
VTRKKGASIGQTLGGIMAGIDGQIFRTTPPVNELIAKGDPIPGVAAAGGGRLTVELPAPVDPDDLLSRSSPPQSPVAGPERAEDPSTP